MKNKICANCKCINGERATYCRRCTESLEAVIPVEAPVVKKKSAPLENKGVRSSDEYVELPKRPAKPDTVYWPFVLSLASGFLMLLILVLFALHSVAEPDDIAETAAVQVTRTSETTTSSTEDPSSDLIDISQAQIGAIADQTYTGEPIEIGFALSLMDGVPLVENEDYTITYDNNVSVGTCNVTILADESDYTGSIQTSFNIVSGDAVCDDPSNAGIVSFVMRLYSNMLGRNPTLDELTADVGRLKNNEITASSYVNGIISGDECVSRGLSDTDFVDAFYNGVLARAADEAGLEYNVSLLSDGMSRSDLVNGIILAPGGEFENICNSLGLAVS